LSGNKTPKKDDELIVPVSSLLSFWEALKKPLPSLAAAIRKQRSQKRIELEEPQEAPQRAVGEAKAKETIVYTVRHGERLDHIDEKWITTSKRPFDPPLSSRGFRQAKEVGEKLLKDSVDINVIYCSPFQRTLQTASEIAQVLKKRIKIEQGLAESIRKEAVAKWEEKEKTKWPLLKLLTEEEIKKEFPLVDFDHKSTAQTNFPEEEQDLYERVVQLVRTLSSKHGGQSILLVSHQTPVEYLAFELAAGNAQDKYVSYCCLSKAVKKEDDSVFKLEYQHEDQFLSEPERGLSYS